MEEVNTSAANGSERHTVCYLQKKPSKKSQRLQEEPVVKINLAPSIPEKIIFCLDENLLSKKLKSQKGDFSLVLWKTVRTFMITKRKIATKPPEFFIMVLNAKPYLYPLFDNMGAQDMLQELRENVDDRACDLSVMFTALAEQLELPDPSYHSLDSHPPPHMYHALLLYGSAHHPTMSNPHPFHFLRNNPFFFLDSVHIRSNNAPDHQLTIVSQVLKSIHSSQEYAFSVDAYNPTELRYHFNKMLSHCVFRSFPDPTVGSASSAT